MDKIDDYIAKQQSPQKEILQKIRMLTLKTLPGCTEEMKWGVPSFADGTYYIVALKDHVNFGILLKRVPDDKYGLLDKIGKTTGHIEIKAFDKASEKRIVSLLHL
jgi:hypothetical protein